MKKGFFILVCILLTFSFILCSCQNNGNRIFKDFDSTDFVFGEITFSPPGDTYRVKYDEKLLSLVKELGVYEEAEMPKDYRSSRAVLRIYSSKGMIHNIEVCEDYLIYGGAVYEANKNSAINLLEYVETIADININEYIPLRAPALKIMAGENFIYAAEGTSTWAYGSTISNKDSYGPLYAKNSLPLIETDDNTVLLKFTVDCHSISDLRCWNMNATEEDYENFEETTINGKELKLKEGEYIYAFTARWYDDKMGLDGDCDYYFRVKKN